MRKEAKELRVGELAKRTGLTVRTLHHWDQVGLLSPGGRTPAGHRLYGGSQIRRLQRILSLRAVGLGLAAGRPVDEEELLETMERMTMIEKHYTPEQLEALAERKESLGPEAIQKAEEEWPRLISAVREAMEKGRDPASEDVQLLAKRWSGLVQAFTGGDSGIETSLGNMHKAEPDMAAKQGLDPALFQYIGAAMVAMKRDG